jgi:hypothetical protein
MEITLKLSDPHIASAQALSFQQRSSLNRLFE